MPVEALLVRLQRSGSRNNFSGLRTEILRLISMPMFATCTKVRWHELFVHEKSRIDNLEKRSAASCGWLLWEFLTEAKLWFSLLRTPILITSIPIFLQHIDLRWNIVFCSWKSWIGVLKDENRRRQFWCFDGARFWVHKSGRIFCSRRIATTRPHRFQNRIIYVIY